MNFLFGDFVLVIGGFFKGIKGYVTDYNGVENKYYLEGVVHIGNHKIRTVNTWINEQELIHTKVEE